MLDMLDPGYWILDIPDAGCWISWMLDRSTIVGYAEIE
jgi:hypothetical protein